MHASGTLQLPSHAEIAADVSRPLAWLEKIRSLTTLLILRLHLESPEHRFLGRQKRTCLGMDPAVPGVESGGRQQYLEQREIGDSLE